MIMSESRVLRITDVLTPGANLEYEVPPKLRERVAAFLDASANTADEPVVPRLSSTVMLLRERQHNQEQATHQGAFQVFMQKRASSMAFVPDAAVFPGGGFNALDDTCDVPWEGPTAGEWALRMGCDEATAKRAVVTAAREVFEECGVLLARYVDGSRIEEPMTSKELRQARVLLSNHELAFGQMLSDINAVLWTDLLSVHAHWVTPPCEPRRYSTYFFRARMPNGQTADGRTTEAVKTGWASPAWLLEQQAMGKLLLMPPTISNLCDLGQAKDVDAACEQKCVVHVTPRPARSSAGTLVFRSVVQ